jgi:hypothetical protein
VAQAFPEGNGYQPPLVLTDQTTAETIKYASNAFLATKFSFINELANICERVGADISDVVMAMGLDPRIGGRYLYLGVGRGLIVLRPGPGCPGDDCGGVRLRGQHPQGSDGRERLAAGGRQAPGPSPRWLTPD